MNIFKKSHQDEEKFTEFIESIDNINEKLKAYSNDSIDISSILKIKQNFIAKTEDFFRKDRKLNIGIIGQVKAGKSSFLNTLIFNGNEVLPKASTPKTAVLTKIEYSTKNSMEIEYYSTEEWSVLEEKACVDSSLNEYVVAKEIIEMARKNSISPKEYLKKENQIIEFNSYDELMEKLNDYVGENGKYTSLIKSVKLNVNNDNLKEISIVDTPGLNDPVASRTDKTKQFMEMCDVVFFLSKASGFLDKSDVELLTAQLPQKGVKRLILVCSRYDDGLADVIFDRDSIVEADIDTKVRLKRHAAKTFDNVIKMYGRRGVSKDFINIIEECKTPVFISSMTYNMSEKSQEDYSTEEMKVYENINYYDDVDKTILKKLGNIDQVKDIFGEVVLQKEETLKSKSSSFIPDANRELKDQLISMRETIGKRINLLSNNDRKQLSDQKKIISSKINGISSDIENIFGQLNLKFEESKKDALKDLRNSSREYSNISEKTGTETHVKSVNVSTSKWYNPFSWGTSRTEYYNYDETYYYIDSADMLENIRNFSKDAASSIEDVFYKSIDIAGIKRKLLNLVIENFDTSDENYDPAYFKLLAEKTLNNIEIPVIKIDVSPFLKSISSKFSGEIRDSSEKSNLKSVFADAISKLFDEITERFIVELSEFKSKIEIIKNSFVDELLDNINSEFDIVLKQLENKEVEIEKSKKFVGELDKLIKVEGVV